MRLINMETGAWILTWVGCVLGAVSIIIAARVLRKQNDVQIMLKEIEDKKIAAEERKFMKSRIDARANLRLEAVLELLTALDKYQAAFSTLKICLEKEAPAYVDVDRKYVEFAKHEGVDVSEQEQVVFHMISKLELLFDFKDREIKSITKKILDILCLIQQFQRAVRENNTEKFPHILNEMHECDAEIARIIAIIPSIFSKYVSDDVSDIAKTIGAK